MPRVPQVVAVIILGGNRINNIDKIIYDWIGPYVEHLRLNQAKFKPAIEDEITMIVFNQIIDEIEKIQEEHTVNYAKLENQINEIIEHNTEAFNNKIQYAKQICDEEIGDFKKSPPDIGKFKDTIVIKLREEIEEKKR